MLVFYTALFYVYKIVYIMCLNLSVEHLLRIKTVKSANIQAYFNTTYKFLCLHTFIAKIIAESKLLSKISVYIYILILSYIDLNIYYVMEYRLRASYIFFCSIRRIKKKRFISVLS